ncbi:hypothetical protein Goshw_004200 [Gossypium schwendimanii]|uniref:Uncharacterized protein n=1 Tax=Gossypium schwendimanii TaxID=34291 RepID=A0A7J9LKC7_GOSSC|nr:hypothetical protein [Gossypium schwendimanii]
MVISSLHNPGYKDCLA